MGELRELDTGSWFAPSFAGERIVTLIEFAELYVPHIPVCLEIKDPLAVEPLMETIRSWDVIASMHVTSFSWTALLHATRVHPHPALGSLSTTFDRDVIQRCVGRGLDQICPPVNLLERRRVDEAHNSGLVVRAWGVRERRDVDLLFATGADGATINWPEWILDRR
ncbi:MAG TPA: glycerophosphodiester phosphodiesterase family protein [Thermomicrobiales bacterium]|nr:glycerophosphodiester phosphodiesterase family protein [Thermomicrobiales bacterium]